MSKTKSDQRRDDLREQFWPGSGDQIWKGPGEVGYWCAPRTLPLLLHLTEAKNIVDNKNCSAVYVELLARSYGQGVVEIQDEDEHAYCAGYTSSRARRTWQERIHILEDIGLIKVAPKGNRAIGYVLLIHPFQAVLSLRQQGKISDQWWHMFQQHLRISGLEPLADPGVSRELRIVKSETEEQTGKTSSKAKRAHR